MKRTVQAKLLILTVFVVGVMTGFVLDDMYETRVLGDAGDRSQASPFPGRQSFSEFLNLTGEQQVEVQAILEVTHEDFRLLRAETGPMYAQLTEQSRDKIREILNEEQLERYNGWIETEGSRRRFGSRSGRNR